MRRLPPLLAALAACASVPGPAVDEGVLRGADLAGVRCLLVAPLENASDVPRAADAATVAVVSAIDQDRVRVLPVQQLRALFRGTPVELPDGIPPSLALELADILGADAALYGTVEGQLAEGGSGLLLTLRLTQAARHDVLFAETVAVVPDGLETPEAAVQRTVSEAGRALFERLGSPPAPEGCFDGARLAQVRAIALGQPAPRTFRPAAPPAPPAASGAAAAAPGPPPARVARPAVLHNRRQEDWARRLAAGERFVVEGIVFEARSPRMLKEGGLADLAAALAAVPGVSVRLEGFVDSSADPIKDAEISAAMAQAAGRRLVALGVPMERLSWSGRGGEQPLLPNFTARGRATNRRVEVVVAR